MKIKNFLLTALLSIVILTSVYAAGVEAEISGTETSTTEITFTINVNEVTDLDTTDFTINYDSAALELVSVEPGTVTEGADISLNKESNTALVNMPGTNGVSGSGSIAKINFNILGEGDKTVSLSDFNIGDRFGSVIEVSSVEYVGEFAPVQEAPKQDLDAETPSAGESQSEQESEKGSSALLYSLIAAAILALIVGGFVLWNKFKKPEIPIQQTPPTVQQQPTQPTQPQPEPQQPDQPTQ
tara:strand:- start:87 stop:809 length:723 start_codon:yes stop_codon:yes gene_type:complete